MAKPASNFYVSVTHLLTSWFSWGIFNIVGLFILIAVFRQIFAASGESTIIVTIFRYLALIVSLAVLWVGTMYSAKWVSRRYVISDAKSVVNRATLYAVLLAGIYFVLIVLPEGIYYGLQEAFGFDLVTVPAAVILFYFSSKKYIQETNSNFAVSSDQTSNS